MTITKYLAQHVFLICCVYSTPTDSCLALDQTTETNRVPIETFFDLKRGATVQEVRDSLKSQGKHQFTAAIDGKEYLCLNFPFEAPIAGYLFYYVFQDNRLKAVVVRPKTEFERIPYKGTTLEVPKAFDPEDKMKTVLESKDLSREEISQRIRQLPKQNTSVDLNVLPAFIIASPLFALSSDKIDGDYRQNAELGKKFDPLKVKPGFTAEEVKMAFGNPLRVIKPFPGKTINIYGNDAPLRINPAYRFSSVLVVFESNKVSRVFSNDFFDARLRKATRIEE